MAFKKKRSRRGGNNRRRNYISRPLFPRKKYSPLNFMDEVPYKDVELLKSYLTERGRILPRRIIGATAGAQRALKVAIQRARNIALLSFAEGYIPQHEPRVYVPRERFQSNRRPPHENGDIGGKRTVYNTPNAKTTSQETPTPQA